MRAVWHELGLQLLGIEDLDEIAECDGDEEQKCRKVLFRWLETDAHATYRQLMAAVKNIGMELYSDVFLKVSMCVVIGRNNSRSG